MVSEMPGSKLRIAILMQGLAQRIETFVADHPWLNADDLFLLSYDRPLKSGLEAFTIYDPECSWAAGRNMLFEAARAKHRFHGFLFMDDDVVFNEGNMRQFIGLCHANPDLFIAPVTERTLKEKGVLDCSFQRPLILDDQMYYIPEALIQRSGVYPLVTDHDQVSWWIACEICQRTLLLHYWSEGLQANRIRIANALHRAGTEGTNYRMSDMTTVISITEAHFRQAGMPLRSYRNFAHRPAKPLALNIWRVFRAFYRLRAPIPANKIRQPV